VQQPSEPPRHDRPGTRLPRRPQRLTHARRKDTIDHSPFDRYVDFWWAAIGVGVSEGRVTKNDDAEKFVTGVVLSQDPWRLTHLELLAIAHTGSSEVIGRPGEVIEIANGYAATGIPILVDILLKKSEPIWDVSNYLQNLAVLQQPDAGANSE